MGFVNDLKQWEKAEEAVAERLQEFFGKWISKNKDKKGVDLIIDDWGLLIEVKFDRMVQDTGNYVFEFMCNEKVSGIERSYNTEEWWTTLPHFIAQSHEGWFELYHTYKLLKYVEENNDRIVKGGDGWRSSMYLIEKKQVEHLAIKKFNW